MDKNTKNLQRWLKWANTIVSPIKKEKFRWFAEEDIFVATNADVVLKDINTFVSNNMYEESFKNQLDLDKYIGEQFQQLGLDYGEGEIWQVMTYSFWLYLNQKYVNFTEVAQHIIARRKPAPQPICDEVTQWIVHSG